MKILYAANNSDCSYYSLKRFLQTYYNYYDIRVAAYTKSIKDLNANWTLDAILDFRGKHENILFDNSNYTLYSRQIKKFAPDLIISDLETYTSHIAVEHSIPLWQVSPSLIYYGTQNKHNIYKYYSAVVDKDHLKRSHLQFAIRNADRRLVISHLCDHPNRPELLAGFEWVRPNYDNLETSLACGVSLSDCFYNGGDSLTTNYTDPESIITSKYAEAYGPATPQIDDQVPFLSQYLKEFDIYRNKEKQ